MIHEGNGYFENCYAADFSLAVPDAQREACWQAWLAHYTRHQPAHRVDYAMRRLEALEAGDVPLQLPGVGATWVHVASDTPSGPELVTLQGPRAGAEAATRLDPSASPDMPHGCSAMCDSRQTACAEPCLERIGPCVDGCARDRAICLGGCY